MRDKIERLDSDEAAALKAMDDELSMESARKKKRTLSQIRGQAMKKVRNRKQTKVAKASRRKNRV